MTKDSVIVFATETQTFNLADLPEGFQIFKIDGEKCYRCYGDLQEDSRIFLIAAPDEKHALAWVQVEFLACSDTSFETYQELLDYLKESEVGEDHDECLTLEGYTNVGDDQYRTILTHEIIPQAEATILLKHNAFDYTNIR